MFIEEVAKPQQEATAQASAWMKAGEVLRSEPTGCHEGHGQRVAHGELGGRRCCGGEVVGTCLLPDRDVEHALGSPGNRAVDLPHHGHKEDPACLQQRHELDEFGRGTTFGNGHHDVAVADQSEVAMQGVCSMKEGGRRSGAVERGHRLSRDVRTLSDAREHEASTDFPPF